MEHAAGAAGGLYLEFAGQKRDQGTITLAVGVAELSATGVVLRAEDASGKLDGSGLEGREAIIRLPHTTEAELDQIQGRVLWTKPQAGKAGEFAIGLELANPDLRVRKTLEDRLQVYPKDIKELWDQWDRVHVRRLPLKADQAVYLVAAAAIGGGVGLFFLGPESLKLYGSILAVYGCMMMAVKSVWAMWQERTMSEE